MQSKMKESQIALSETQSKQLPTEFELTRMTHEKQLLESKVQYLEEELSTKTKAERELRQAFSAQLHEVETRLQTGHVTAEDYAKQISALKVCSTVHCFSQID